MLQISLKGTDALNNAPKYAKRWIPVPTMSDLQRASLFLHIPGIFVFSLACGRQSGGQVVPEVILRSVFLRPVVMSFVFFSFLGKGVSW